MLKLFNVRNRVAIITGGMGMLGSEYAIVLGQAGAKVILFDMLEITEMKKRTDNLARLIGKKPYIKKVDVADEKDVSRAVKEVYEKYGRIDILINNAALTDLSLPGNFNRFAPFEKFSFELWNRELAVTLHGAFLCSRAVIPFMKKARRGTIVNISSTYGVVGPDNRIYEKGRFRSVAYATAKSGILNFSRALASYLAPYGIRVNTFTPGGVFARHDRRFLNAYSYRTMLGRMANKEEYRGPMLFLCSDASSYMTGSNLIVDGGWTAW